MVILGAQFWENFVGIFQCKKIDGKGSSYDIGFIKGQKFVNIGLVFLRAILAESHMHAREWPRDLKSCDFENELLSKKQYSLRMFTVIIDQLGVFKWQKALNSFNKSLSLELSLKSILLKKLFLKSNFKNKSKFIIDQTLRKNQTLRHKDFNSSLTTQVQPLTHQ